jgi:hypothetical protein
MDCLAQTKVTRFWEISGANFYVTHPTAIVYLSFVLFFSFSLLSFLCNFILFCFPLSETLSQITSTAFPPDYTRFSVRKNSTTKYHLHQPAIKIAKCKNIQTSRLIEFLEIICHEHKETNVKGGDH